MAPNDSADDAPVLVYDGECAICSRMVLFLLARDPGGRLRFAARGGDAGRAVRARHPELLRVESLLWVERGRSDRPDEPVEERVYTHSDAALRAVSYLGGSWALVGRAGSVVPRLLRDPVYRVIAFFRRRIFGRADPACALGAPREAHRFLA